MDRMAGNLKKVMLIAAVLVGLLVWSAGSVLLTVAGWMAGSTYRARRLQWEAEAASAT